MTTTPLRRSCAWTAPNGESWSLWSKADQLHALAGSFAEPYATFLSDGGWTEDEKPEVDYRLRQVHETVALRAALDEATTEAVDNARTTGATWEQIGEALGITRQAAQMRFRAVRVVRSDWCPDCDDTFAGLYIAGKIGYHSRRDTKERCSGVGKSVPRRR